MPVDYILSQAGRKIGLNASNPNDRVTLLRYLNEAAPELYAQSDMDGTLMEQVFKVNGDQTISLPYYVGPVRAVRELASNWVWSIHQMRPRYNKFNWKDCFRNLRMRNLQALQYTVTNQSKGVITVPVVEDPPIVVSVVGPTDSSSQAQESVTMDAVSKTTANCYNDYITVMKDRVNDYDVTLSDADGNILTVIPNSMCEAKYQIIDVSIFPFLNYNPNSPVINYLEILYKQALIKLENDTDSFPSKTNYDDVLVNKICQLYFEEQKNPEQAMAYDAKATRTLARLHEDQNRGAEEEIALTQNPHDTLHSKIGGGRWSPSLYRRGWFQ